MRHHRSGIKRIRHPEVGDLELAYEAMSFPANPEWFMFGYTAEPGSPSEELLKLLGSLAAVGSGDRASNSPHTSPGESKERT